MKNPYLTKIYELRFRVNKFSYEIIDRYNSPVLAYGMRKKFIKENPAKYCAAKLYVRIV